MSTAASHQESPIAVECPECKTRLKAFPHQFGTTKKCPVCHARVAIEAPDDPESPAPEPEHGSEILDAIAVFQPEPDFPAEYIYDADDVIEEDDPPSAYASRPSGMSMRMKHWLVWGVIRFGLSLFLVMVGAFIPPIGCLGFVLLAWYWPARWLSRQVTASLSPTIDCPGCGFQFDAVSRWTVGQYTDHREQHILLVKSPLDGCIVNHTDCPQCGATILI
jgi:hypothetical protein